MSNITTAARCGGSASGDADATDIINIYHITFGTYGTRLHGGNAPTVDKRHNQPGEPFVAENCARLQWHRRQMKSTPVIISIAQCVWIESEIPISCDQLALDFITAACQNNHCHPVHSPAENH